MPNVNTSQVPNPNVDDSAIPLLFRHCQTVFEQMRKQCQRAEVEGQVMYVWSGFFTKLITKELGFSSPYYSIIKNALMGMGSIRQLQRGGGNSPSKWQLVREPDMNDFRAAQDGRGVTARAVTATHEQRYLDLSSRVAQLERNQARFVDWVNTSLTASGLIPTEDMDAFNAIAEEASDAVDEEFDGEEYVDVHQEPA